MIYYPDLSIPELIEQIYNLKAEGVSHVYLDRDEFREFKQMLFHKEKPFQFIPQPSDEQIKAFEWISYRGIEFRIVEAIKKYRSAEDFFDKEIRFGRISIPDNWEINL